MFLKNQAAFFSANLHQYLPEIPWREHPALFKLHQNHHQARPISEGNAMEVFTALHPNSLVQPGLLAAFHLGAHTKLPVSLARSRVEFDILIDRQVHHRYRAALSKTDDELVRSGLSPTMFFYSDDPRLFFQIRRSLRSGRHILIFVDGNGGMDTEEGMASLLDIPFFRGTLWLRQGIAVLARVLQVPIYPILNGRKVDQSQFQVLPPIKADTSLPREADAKRILKMLYAELEKTLIREGFMCWECWRYLHTNGMLRMESFMYPPHSDALKFRPDSASKFHSNSVPEYIVPLDHPLGHFWMDKSRYEIHFSDNILKIE